MCQPLSDATPAAVSVPEPSGSLAVLRCCYVREDRWYPDWYGDEFVPELPIAADHVPRDANPPEFDPYRIAWELQLTGGFFAGLKLNVDAGLEMIFIDERGQIFEVDYGYHKPWRVVSFLPRGVVRIRLFNREFSWRRPSGMLMRNSDYYSSVALAVTSPEGERHEFVFWVTDEFRDLFPAALAEVT